MPLFSSFKAPSPLAESLYPSYVVKSLGSRHILIGGGGGAARTGVGNGIELFLLSYNSFPKVGAPYETLKGKKTGQIDTEKRSVMNLDCVALAPLDSGKYLLAVGEDYCCYFYETTGFDVVPDKLTVDVPSQLSYNFRPVGKVISVQDGPKGYQKCVRFDRSSTKPLRVATGGTDGYVRIWNAFDIFQNRDPTIERKPIVEFLAEDSEVNELDFSCCGSMIVTVTKKIQLWNTKAGNKLTVLETPQISKQNYVGRSAKFVNLNPQSTRSFLMVAHNMRQQTTKSNCYLSVWVFDPENKQARILEMKELKQERVITTTVSMCQNYYGVGFARGTVGVFTTRELQQLYYCEAHSNTVTSVEFLPRRTLDTSVGRIEQSGGQNFQTFLPGVTSESMVSLVSISMDLVARINQVAYPSGFSSLKYWVKASFWIFVFYLFLWSIL